MSTTLKKGNILYAFNAEGETELSVSRGDIVIVKEQFDDGWSYCKLASNLDKKGYVPSQYIEILQSFGVGANKKNQPQKKKVIKKPKLQKVDAQTIQQKRQNLAEVGVQFKYYTYYLKFKRFQSRETFKKQKKRLFNIKETLSTEETYLKQLCFCISAFKKPIAEKKLLKESFARTLFSDIERVRDISQTLYGDLCKNMKSFPVAKIGHCFKAISPFFKMYKTFINNYDESSKTLEKCKKKYSAFTKFCEKTTSQTPSYARNYKLDDFLILPIQRIPRYKMLLNNIVSATSPQHIEFKDLSDALRIVSEVADFVNKAKKEKQHMEIQLEIAKAVKGRYETLIQSHRKFVASTNQVKLTCRSLNINKPSDYTIYLFNDLLISIEPSNTIQLKAPKAFFFFLLVSTIQSDMNNNLVLILKGITKGKLVDVTFTFQNSKTSKDWLGMINTQIESTLISNKNKGYSNVNMLALATERLQESKESKEGIIKIKEENRVTRSKGTHTALDELRKIDKNIEDNEKQLMKFAASITKLEVKKHDLSTLLEKLEILMIAQRDTVINHYKNIKKKDHTFVTYLGNEINAFKEIFGSHPMNDSMMPKIDIPKYQQQRTTVNLSNGSPGLKPRPPRRMKVLP